MKIAIAQTKIVFEDKEKNKKRISSLIEKYKGKLKNADWIIFPEFTLSGFSLCTDKTTLNPCDIEFFQSFARQYSVYCTFGGVLGRKNVSITLDKKGREINCYEKIHLYSYGEEHKSYLPGKKLNTSRSKISM